ncbi:radical SAM protein [Parvibaculum sp.]|uniref:radical SAM protein n=1 Tax=Parvibaculum sp. TaxID=2024848 RepID=UPI001B2A2CFD|nr:radical SAM protein [Parvibaculum sp.]MBO6677988.1 radical SAM protein [Parvibaculum sp.]MBO6683320.1 radical SAM protein [Parvibaculum sp.]MBO6903599.1 radical SAM protein [Parvibaculum sp.]
MTDRVYEQQFGEAAGVDVSPLSLRFDADGDVRAMVCNEIMVPGDKLTRFQAFPGAELPDFHGRTRFPVPDRPGEYCDQTTFLEMPKYMAQWIHWPDRVKAVLEGRYFDLPPAHYEGIFTLVCNFLCPHCTRRTTRLKWVDGGTWNHNTPISEANTLHPTGLRRVIDELAELRVDNQMGIIWGGGDPTSNPFTYDGMLYARAKGISASFLTNGVFLEVDRCLDADPTLIRISLNCGTEEAYRRFHGYPKGWDYFAQIKIKMRELVRRKIERRAKTLIGISLIIDERNINDVVAAAEEIRAVVDEVGPGIDYVIVRPVMNYSHFQRDYAMVRDGTKDRARYMVEPGGPVWTILNELGIPLILIKDSFDQKPEAHFYESDSDCLAYGLCGEIRHNGDVQLCSDSYGNPEYTIGNIFERPLRDILKSDRRREVLDRINGMKCYETRCPHNSRGHHHNRVFHQIEAMRRAGKMDEVAGWIDDMRACTHDLGHSFFI